MGRLHRLIGKWNDGEVAIEYFEKGGVGLVSLSGRTELYAKILDFQPNVIVVVAGSNDIDSQLSRENIISKIDNLVIKWHMEIEQLKGLYIFEPMMREVPSKLPRNTDYGTRRNWLKRCLCKRKIMVRFGGPHTNEFCKDGVHPKLKCLMRLHRAILQLVDRIVRKQSIKSEG